MTLPRNHPHEECLASPSPPAAEPTPDAALRAAQGALRASQDFTRATLDGLGAHIAIVDEAGTIVAVNRAWRDFARSNPPASSAVGEGANYLRVCDAASGDCADEAGDAAAGIRSVLAGERELFTLEYPCHSPAERRWFCLRVTRFPGDGPARAVVLHENVTGRREAEEALSRRVEELTRMAAALERKNQELDQFAYITSHDLKAPLRGIANLSRWIEEDLGDRLTEEVTEHLHLMRGRVHRMEAMIEGILQYARIGRTPIPPERVDVGALLAGLVDLLDPPPAFHIAVAPGMPTLSAQRVPLEQVFLNLIGNAVKHHGRADGRVTVSAREAGDFWEFAVTDDGPGIAPAYHEKVFQIFQTLEARDRVENTGVGLALVRKIVEGQGGAVSLESDAGAGACFRFTWPKRPPQSSQGTD